jgi:hypothetical protein
MKSIELSQEQINANSAASINFPFFSASFFFFCSFAFFDADTTTNPEDRVLGSEAALQRFNKNKTISMLT